MDCYLVKIHWPSEAFGGARMCNFGIKTTDGATFLSIWEKWEISNRLVIHIKREM